MSLCEALHGRGRPWLSSRSINSGMASSRERKEREGERGAPNAEDRAQQHKKKRKENKRKEKGKNMENFLNLKFFEK
jgi:hypothetical protein